MASYAAGLKWMAAFAAALIAAPAARAADEGPPPRPPLPAITELKVTPPSLAFSGARDLRRAIVSGKTEGGAWIDLTSLATYEPAAPVVKVDDAGFFHPVAAGSAEVAVFAAGLKATLPVEVKDAAAHPIRFTRDVMPALSKLGCNAGTCHGSAKGKNGFKLSLRGYDAHFDYQSLIDDLSGRRFNRAAPAESLMLMKPTGAVPHEGGQVLKPDSAQYALLREWIEQGVSYEDQAAGRATSVEILPAEVEIALPGMEQQLIVLAHYADGEVRDVTREADFTSSVKDTAIVSPAGLVTAVRRGETAILVRYEGNYATRGLAVMGDRAGFEWKEARERNYVDKHVNAKLAKMKILPSAPASDAEFLRRVYLDLTGLPPTLDQVRFFLADDAPSEAKRAWVIERLIGSPAFVDHWTSKWADLLQCNEQALGERGVWIYRDWIERQVEANTPYDQFVRTLLTARGSALKTPEANFWRVLRETDKATEDISQVFLGTRFNCAKCHDHPFERWTQNQYYEFGAFFARVGVKPGQLPGEEIVYTRFDANEVHHPKSGAAVPPKTPFGAAASLEENRKRNEAFAEWMTSKENPLFAKAMANRLWSYFFGRGIIDPVDDIRASNPPSNPELLDALTQDFIAGGFDLRRMMRVICNSEAYQRSIAPNEWNADDTANFARALPRRLSAEQLLDAIAAATGVRSGFQGMPADFRAADLPGGMVGGQNFLELFGRPKRKSACECERTNNVSLSHALNLINGPTIGQAVANPQGRIAKLVAEEKAPEKIVEDIYLAVLCRPPTDEERATVSIASAATPLEGAQDLAWALMNSPAFLFNR